MNRLFVILILSLGCLTSGLSQVLDLSAPVDLVYRGESLEEVLRDIDNRYGVRFSYSPDRLPLGQPIYAEMRAIGFKEGLDSLFLQTQVIYGFIGEQIVLSVDPNKELHPPTGSRERPSDDWYRYLAYRPEAVEPVPVYASLDDGVYDFYEDREWPRAPAPNVGRITRVMMLEETYREDTSDIQITVLPGMTMYPVVKPELKLSINIIAGVNESVKGLEAGLIANVLQEDLDGVQLSGGVNLVKGDISGVQMASLLNVAGSTRADRFGGMQWSGGANLAFSDGNYWQFASVGNISTGRSGGQLAGLINVGKEVAYTQISGFMNVGQRVDGAQIGLINVADSVGGVSLGLISIVKKGYRSVELAGEDVVYGNLSFRTGMRPFYNILRLGSSDEKTWALGYGLGTSFKLGKRNYLQLELMATHVNEREWWTDELNLLGQFNINADIALSKHMSLAVGPTFNFFFSRRYDPERNIYGSQLPNYTIYEKTWDDNPGDPVNMKYWIGIHAGIRFNSG